MRIFTYKQPVRANDRSAVSRSVETPPLAPGVAWVRFGGETLFLSDDDQQSRAPASRGARVPHREADVTKEQLHVVVQHGRTFQQHNPDVPVLHDRGRFLLVKLDPEHAKQLATKHETCYGVMPLTENQPVFDVRARAAAARAPVAFVQNLVDKVNRASLEQDLEKLVSFPTRHSTSSSFTEAIAFAQQQLEAAGIQTRQQTVNVNGADSRNIIADKAGNESDETRKVVIVCAHLDSVNAAGASANAPGADDNGSGSAGILEIARAFQEHRAMHDLRLILFGGEEQGLFGSRRYVASLNAAERARIKAVVNMDMIGSKNSDTRSVLIEGSAVSQSVIDGLSEAGATYTQLSIETSLNPFNSDHVPFINAQLPAALTIEGADSTNENIHSANDTIDKIDYDTVLEILRMNVAFVATEIGNAP